MKSKRELVKTKGYILANIQNDLYGEVSSYMETKELNQSELAKELKVSKSYISQILNGNFNYTISKLIDLSLAIGKIPFISYKEIDEAVKEVSEVKEVSLNSKEELYVAYRNVQVKEKHLLQA
jgi:transcriptional regulator with XRE-family HTH domain